MAAVSDAVRRFERTLTKDAIDLKYDRFSGGKPGNRSAVRKGRIFSAATGGDK